jgi:hypothetical protein
MGCKGNSALIEFCSAICVMNDAQNPESVDSMQDGSSLLQ